MEFALTRFHVSLLGFPGVWSRMKFAHVQYSFIFLILAETEESTMPLQITVQENSVSIGVSFSSDIFESQRTTEHCAEIQGVK